MIAALIQLLVLFIVLAIIWYVIRLVATHFGVPGVFIQVVGLILFLIWLLAALSLFGLVPGGHWKLAP